MYLILELSTDLQATVANHLFGTITDARVLLEETMKKFVEKEYGSTALDTLKVYKVDSLDNIQEPIDHGVYAYINQDHDTIHVYRKHTKKTTGYLWSSYDDAYTLVTRYLLVKYDNLSYTNQRDPEMVASGSGKGVRVPVQMTISPFADLLKDLKSSQKFLARHEKND